MQPAPNTPQYKLPNAIARRIVTVELDDGTIVERYPAHLVVLPPGLVHPLEDYE